MVTTLITLICGRKLCTVFMIIFLQTISLTENHTLVTLFSESDLYSTIYRLSSLEVVMFTSAVFRHDLRVKCTELAPEWTCSLPLTHAPHSGRLSAQTRSQQQQILHIIQTRGGAAGSRCLLCVWHRFFTGKYLFSFCSFFFFFHFCINLPTRSLVNPAEDPPLCSRIGFSWHSTDLTRGG